MHVQYDNFFHFCIGDSIIQELTDRVIRNGHRPSLMELVTKHGYDCSKKQNGNGETLLHLACKSGHLDIVRTLVEIYACDLVKPDNFGNSPCHTACANGQFKVLYYFYTSPYGHEYPPHNNDDNNILHLACGSGSVETTRLVVLSCISDAQHVKLNDLYDDILSILFFKNNFGVLPNTLQTMLTTNDKGLTPLHVACMQNYLQIVKFFFCEVQVSLNIDLMCHVPSLLMIACKHRYTDLVLYLSSYCQVMQHQIASLGNANILGIHSKSPKFLQFESPLYFAAKCGDLKFFKELMKHDQTSSYCYNQYGDSLLHAASISGSIDMVELVLIHFEEDIHYTNIDGNTCLHLACEWGSQKIMQYFIREGLSINSLNKFEDTPLHLSIRHEREDIFDYLLSQKVDINAKNILGDTPLHIAASDPNLLKYAEHLLSHADLKTINSPNIDGDTPIFCACRTRSVDMIRLFMHHPSCEILMVNKVKHETIANIACRAQLYDLLNDLLKAKYPQRLQNYMGQTLLYQACRYDDVDMVKFLASSENSYMVNEDINLNDDVFKITPLQLACKRKNVLLFKCLLKIPGCDPDAKDKVGDTVLHICCKIDHEDMASICVDMCSKTIRNDKGNTPLHEACYAKNYEMLEWLLRKLPSGSKLDSFINNDGNNLLHVIAVQEGTTMNILRFLIENGICDHQSTHERSGETTLHMTCHAGLLDNSVYLIKLEYDIDSCWINKRGESPLLSAFLNQKYDVLKACVPSCTQKMLMNCGKFNTNPDSTGTLYSNTLKEFRFPLAHYLLFRLKHTPHSINGHQSLTELQKFVFDLVIHFLIDEPFSSLDKHIDVYGNTVLHFLARCDYLKFDRFDEFVKKTIKEVGVNCLSDNSATPLHCACSMHQDWMIMTILNAPNGSLYVNNTNALKQPGDYFSSYYNSTLHYLLTLGSKNKFDIGHFRSHDKPELSSIRIITLGNSSVGKSTLIESLRRMITKERNQFYPVDPTTGLVRSEFLYHGNSNKQICFYDFAGQVEFETSHSIYLENLLSAAGEQSFHVPFVFMLIVKATETIENNKLQIDRWTAFIRSHIKHDIKSFYFILVCTHEDLLDEGNKSTYKMQLELYLGSKYSPPFVNSHESIFLLNGLKTDTVPVNKLSNYLDDIFISCEKITESTVIDELVSFLDEWFGTKPCQIKDLIIKIKECRKFKLDSKYKIICEGSHPKMAVPEEPNALADLLIQLHARNQIMLLRQAKEKLDWWIVNKSVQNKLFSSVNSLFSPRYFRDAPNHLSYTHNTGVVPVGKLQDIFSDIDIDWNLILEYLISMEYCKEVPDDIYNQMTFKEDCKPDASMTKLYFFPGLLKKGKGEDVYANIDDYCYCFGWMMESKARLGLRFLHSILLQLTFKFARRTPTDSPFQRKIHLWKNGLSWFTKTLVEVLVEMKNERELVMLCRCKNDVLERTEFVKYRSNIVKEIRLIKENLILSGTDISVSTECCLYPPPKFYTSLDNCDKISLEELSVCFKEPLSSRTIEFKNSIKPIHMNTILFEPYAFLQTSDLKKLGSEEQLSLKSLKEITGIKEFSLKPDVISYLELCSVLDSYSIFEGRQLAVMMRNSEQ